MKSLSLSVFFLCLWVSDALSFNAVYVTFGSNLGQTIPSRITNLLRRTGAIVSEYSADVESSLTPESLVLSFGNSALCTLSLDGLAPESYRVQSRAYRSDSTLVCSNGLPIDAGDRKFALNVSAVHYGAAVGAYAAMELLGFSFLHPLQPYTPTVISLAEQDVYISESPYWEKRTWHIHTQHPLEFTEVLNGFDIPMYADDDDAKCAPGAHCETWESMFATLDGLFEWLLANRQNRVEVLLLGNEKWERRDLNSGPVRQGRLAAINALSHQYGILIGADIPLANLQQHGWAMISLRDDLETQTKDIQDRVDWAFQADFDFISTESGLSEFTKPTCDLMLQLFEVYTAQGKNAATS